jgi:5'-3' exoribonuclease 1
MTPICCEVRQVDAHLRYFICKKMEMWCGLTVIYSGQDVPGEGEHKIMQFIRDMKASPKYRPNIRHCLYGQDADLIMLGLATHEPYFSILREVVAFGESRLVIRRASDVRFELLHLSALRGYLEKELLGQVPEEARDVERMVDDFVLMTFLVGNDFLPHLPSLDIATGAFSRLFSLYRQHIQQWEEGQGYLVGRGKINGERLQAFLSDLGKVEDEMLEEKEVDIAAVAAGGKPGGTQREQFRVMRQVKKFRRHREVSVVVVAVGDGVVRLHLSTV